MPDPQHEVQAERGERDHHERLEQLQLGDENVEESIQRSKEESRDRKADEPLMPEILVAPETQYREL